MSFIEIEYNEHTGWFCNNDLILICDRETFPNDTESLFMDDNKLQTRRRYIPKVNFNDEKLFPSMNISMNNNEELLSELNSMLAGREYVRKQNDFFDRKQFQQAQAAQAEEEKKFQDLKKRRQHPSYISRFDEKRYVPTMRKKFYRFHD
jgi:hypothetical protein